MGTTLGATATLAGSTFRAIQAIVAAGVICGTLDGLSALIISGVKWTIVFQFIASGVLGPNSFKGGIKTVLLGIALHFLIALTGSTVYYLASLALPAMLQYALPFGVAFGICVHLFMQFVVLPLSHIGRRPFTLRGFTVQLLVHMIVVGPSIALSLRRFLR